MTKISVIVPVYNVENYLSKCLDSLLKQTFDDFEIILINDGSTDNSLNIINQYKDKRIKLINKKNEGQAIARNFGIKKASGEFIMFVDSDDYVDKDILKISYNNAIQANADIVCFDSYLVADGIIENNQIKKIKSDDDKKNFILNQSGPCFMLIKTNIIKDNNLFFPKLNAYEDIALVPSYGLFAKKIIFINDKLYYYVIRSGSTMNQIEYSSKLEQIFDAMKNLSKIFKEKKVFKKYYSELEYLYIEHLLHGGGLRFLKFKKHDQIKKINKTITSEFPNWKNNFYYKKQPFKYRVMCELLFKEKFKLINLLKRGDKTS